MHIKETFLFWLFVSGRDSTVTLEGWLEVSQAFPQILVKRLFGGWAGVFLKAGSHCVVGY